jgi:hypothetical protein|tara:strand:+ start:68 stop:799 length:732 start_codon:yes stop_codon:yes gene_type:complete
MFLSTFIFFVQGGDFAFHLSSRLVDEGDSILNAWILAWDSHALFNPEVSVWNAPIFYPVKNTPAFSENLIGNLWVTLPVQLITDNHILSANVLILVSFVLGSYFFFLLVKDITNNYWSSLLAGLIFLDTEKTSKNGEGVLNAEWKAMRGIINQSQFNEVDLAPFKITVKNSGSAIWLDPKLNSLLYDSYNGNIHLSLKIFDRSKEMGCSSNNRLIKEIRLPIKRDGTITFERGISIPFSEGLY